MMEFGYYDGLECSCCEEEKPCKFYELEEPDSSSCCLDAKFLCDECVERLNDEIKRRKE